jgi:hypothetical protein
MVNKPITPGEKENMDDLYPLTISPERFNIRIEQNKVSIPCAWSHPISKYNHYIERIVIVVHGVLRNADEYFPNMKAAVTRARVEENTLVIAPQFLIEDDITRFGLPDDILFWGEETGEGWKKGDDSISTAEHPRSVSASAFEVVDELISRVADLNIFPKLGTIIVAGHSAGGQFVNRYAAGTQIEASIPAECHLRFIVANPSTYMYFSGERWVSNTTNEFAIPDQADPDYDDYKYGLENLNRYMATAGLEAIQARFPAKNVVYLLGGEDTLEAHLEQTPNAMLQGTNRLARGQIYYHYLQHYFGKEITNTQKIAIIPCVGHDNAAIFSSEAGLKFLFDKS